MRYLRCTGIQISDDDLLSAIDEAVRYHQSQRLKEIQDYISILIRDTDINRVSAIGVSVSSKFHWNLQALTGKSLSAILRDMRKQGMIRRVARRSDKWKVSEEHSNQDNECRVKSVKITSKQMRRRRLLMRHGETESVRSRLSRGKRKIVDKIKPNVNEQIPQKKWIDNYWEWRNMYKSSIRDHRFQIGSGVEIRDGKSEESSWMLGHIVEILPPKSRQKSTKYRVKLIEREDDDSRCERIVIRKHLREIKREKMKKVTLTSNARVSWTLKAA